MMVQGKLGHILDTGSALSQWWIIAAVALVGFVIVEHHIVAGFDRVQLARRGRVAIGIAVIAALAALGAVAAPTSDAQSAAMLPDLISDPPRPAFLTELNTPDGGTRLVATFDGYVHNIGEGALDVVGNPQETNGMQQRVRNGDSWETVGSPTVRFETDDGHNHFHLIAAIDYVLWNELQGTQAAAGSKIGFCLVDTEQMEPGSNQAYSEALDNFCEENNPGATDLRMGISPGWRDIYDATTTLQWVDISNTPPGRYWIGAITDPNNEILESNEDNNELIFSKQTMSVPGFAPRRQAPVAIAEPSSEITLTSTAHGSVTSPVYVIEQGPSSGRLDVPIGSDLGASTLRYFPDEGFEGTDEIVFSVHDAASPYPFDRPTQTIELQVAAGAGQAPEGPDAGQDLTPSLATASSFFESSVGEAITIDIESVDATGGPARLFATGLPAGLTVDSVDQNIRGVAIEDGIFEITLVAIGVDPAAVATLDITWIVNPNDTVGGLTNVADQSSPRGELTRLRVGTNALGLSLDASGLPPGLALKPGSPLVEGTPTEAGTYNVVIRQANSSQPDGGNQDSGNSDGGAAETSFTWTIRPSVAIEFAL